MCKKLLKYDFAYVFKIWLALSISVVGMAIVTSLIIRSAIFINTQNGASMASTLSVLAAVFMSFGMIMIWVGILIVTPLMCYIRYYKNFFSDEGYLTFTLPVRRRDLYLAKVANTFIFQAANVVVSLLAVSILMLLIPPAEEGQLINPVVFRYIGQGIRWLWSSMGGWLLMYGVLLIAFMAIRSLYNIGMIQLCITVGATVAKKHKVLAGVGIYFGSGFAMSTISQVVNIFTGGAMIGFVAIVAERPDVLRHPIVILTIFVILLMMLTAATVLHLITLNLIERKLNLA